MGGKMTTATQTDSRRFNRSNDTSPEQLLDQLLLFAPVSAPGLACIFSEHHQMVGSREK
jgi:hypothetical protein